MPGLDRDRGQGLEPSGAPAWASTPSWYLGSARDQAIPSAAQRFMADRMHARTREIDASHASLVSKPGEVADSVRAAAR
ncbi:alpha/beta fold hydrolase [Nocardia sp. NPDC051787]|uniref:alpha/beta fold hydrolase n=1 Tax=Nocardia sp. NPDC051787 TaxID=3155415 RepID=UPI00341FFB4D